MIKEIFDIENYKGAYVMHCDTNRKAYVFIKYLNSVDDNLWRVNLCNPNTTFWWVNGEKTCYNFNIGTFGTTRQFEERNYKTLEFDDFYWGEENSPKEDSIQEALQKVEDAKHKEAHEFLQGKKTGSMVNHPKHYQGNKFEVIDIIEDFDLNFSLGSAIKYILRAGKKDERNQDLEKAIWYLQREL